jgi:hypothetical protein
MLKPFPKASINTGHPGPTSGSPQNPPLHTKPLQHGGVVSLQVSPVPRHSPPPPPSEPHAGTGPKTHVQFSGELAQTEPVTGSLSLQGAVASVSLPSPLP